MGASWILTIFFFLFTEGGLSPVALGTIGLDADEVEEESPRADGGEDESVATDSMTP